MKHLRSQFRPKQGGAAVLVAAACALLLASGALAQVRSGGAYLKVIPGARQQAMSRTLTGSIDQMYAFFANPGATGLLRHWQLSGSVTRWVPGIYNATILYGGRTRTPWSRYTGYALAVSYLGIKEFNSTDPNNPAAPASGGDLLLTASLGQSLRFISDNLSIGGNVKYFRGQLDNFNSASFIFDAGVLYRTPRFRLGGSLFEYGIVSAGLSITQMGKALNFNEFSTPLPKTVRAGAALNMGTHDALQWLLAADYRKIRDEDGYFSMGTELSHRIWHTRLSLRGGYTFEEKNLLGHWAFGFSIRFDRLRRPVPKPKNALRFDYASLVGNNFFDPSYLGTLSYYPLNPEPFRFITPENHAEVQSDSVRLRWEDTRDPDLYDDVFYWLIADNSREAIEQAVAHITTQEREHLFALPDSIHLTINDTLAAKTDTLLQGLRCGDYYWAVFAYDRNRLLQPMQKGGESIYHFRVILPDFKITITEVDSSRCVATLLVQNIGEAPGYRVAVALVDSIDAITCRDNIQGMARLGRFFAVDTIQTFAPFDSLVYRVQLDTTVFGQHNLLAQVDAADRILECDESNNADRAASRCVLLHDLQLTKTASKDSVFHNEPYTYRITLKNLGPRPAYGITVLDTLPVTIVANAFSQAPDSTWLSPDSSETIRRWSVCALAPGDSLAITYEAIAALQEIKTNAMVLKGVNFITNKSFLTPASKKALDDFTVKLRRALKKYPGLKLEIGGHTDITGPIGLNDTLSYKRAQSVWRYLVYEKGIPDSNLTYEGWGPCLPIATNATREGRRLNRRVEIRLSDSGALPVVNRVRVFSANDVNPANDADSAKVVVRESLVSKDRTWRFSFRARSDSLSAAAMDTLDRIRGVLECLVRLRLNSRSPDRRTVRIEVVGYTDSTGTAEYNQRLSLKRAQAVVNYLASQSTAALGQNGERLGDVLKAVGYGELKPIADNGTPEGRRRNRRVEFYLNGRKIFK